MKLKEYMNCQVETIHPSESVQSAAHRMESLNVGLLAVVEADMPIGLISERDIITRAVALGLDPKLTRIREVMTMNLDSLSEDADIEEALRLMEDKHLQEVIVHSPERPLAGVVTLADLLREEGVPALSGTGGPSPSYAKTHPR